MRVTTTAGSVSTLPTTDVRDASDYITSAIETIDGWFDPRDALLWTLIDGMQQAQGVTGDLLEVGVFLGKSAVLLGYLAHPGENVVVCDLFEDQPLTGEVAAEHARFYQGLTRSRFEANYLRFHDELPMVIQGSSTESLVDLKDESFRFIHIDGSHSYDVVVEDVQTAKRLCGPRGVVVFDDVFTGHTPGVCAAVWNAVVHDGLRPLAITNKLYGTWSDDTFDVDELRAAIDAHPSLRAVDVHAVAGKPMLEVHGMPKAAAAPSLLHDLVPPAARKAARLARQRWRERRSPTAP